MISKNPSSVSPAIGTTSFPAYDEILTTFNRTQQSFVNIEPPSAGAVWSKEVKSVKRGDKSVEILREKMIIARKKLSVFKDRLKTILKNYPRVLDAIKQNLLKFI